MKISSARLKPDEASDMLQEDGDETRVGGISVQIMAQIQQAEQQQQQQRENHDAASSPRADGNDRPSAKPPAAAVFKRSKLRAAGDSGGGGGGGPAPGPRRPAFRPLVSRLTPQPRQDGISLNADGMVLTPAPSITAEKLDVSVDLSDAARAGAVAGTATRKLKGLRSVGGARRFQAPRSSGVAAVASRGTTTPAMVGTSPFEAREMRSNAAVQQSSELVGVSRTLGDPPVGCVSDISEKRSGNGGPTPDVRVNPEDLVLEWTAGNPPQPLRAGASLARRLHPHQREGLKVLWECLAGRGG